MSSHCSNFSPDAATFTKPVDFKGELLPFVCAKSQNLARLYEIAKFSTRKISAIPKSQNFVLANNSNNKISSQAYTNPCLPLLSILTPLDLVTWSNNSSISRSDLVQIDIGTWIRDVRCEVEVPESIQ